MMSKSKFTFLFFVTLALLLIGAGAQTTFAQTGKRPVIVIPGITGSELINGETKKNVWFHFSFSHGESDDLRLPMSPDLAQNRDKIIPGDIIREIDLPGVLTIFPDIHVYDEALESLAAAGYSEASWDDPRGADAFYVFSYDWRRDNVESARQLIEKIEAVKTKLNRPDLKFDIVAHSMGGLVARYAAIYGNKDLPNGNKAAKPDWAGARHINKLLLFGTPNEGSFSAFETLLRGYKIGPSVFRIVDINEDAVFTIPSLYQLLPFGASAQILDENLKPLKVDLYDAATWRKYGWGAIGSPKFRARLKNEAQTKSNSIKNSSVKSIDDQIHADTRHDQAFDFLTVVLSRAEKFHRALSAETSKPPIEISVYGGDCEETLSAIVLTRNKKKNAWETVISPHEIHTLGGQKVSKEKIKSAIYATGDGRVTKQSLLAGSATRRERKIARFSVKSANFVCAPHARLLDNREMLKEFLPVLTASANK